ncbi:ABC transporter permease [Lysobacter hankyongensis]|uniref:ABC transporter permease n=1 Tax=Lysobacter hankyongensis TaxID=1176535 RepID=A0ABP9BQS6_9GAMM
MNTSIAPAAAARPHSGSAFGFAHKLKLLIKREYWENRSFLWAPAITGIIASVFAVIAMIGVTIFVQKAKREGDFGDHFKIDGEDLAGRGLGILSDGILANGIMLAMLVTIFVVFFYALGSLYDERRDRSVLFWKSLPVSDLQVVLSKVAWALVLGPVVGLLVGVAIGIVMWLIVALALVVNGIPGVGTLITGARPLHVLGQIFGVMPVYIAWSVPTIGWLMLCSAWSRRFPFLWAVLIPLLGCAMVSMTGQIFAWVTGAEFPHEHLWYVVALRGLCSLIPGLWFVKAVDGDLAVTSGDGISPELDVLSSWSAFGSLDMWIGIAVGVAMIAAAIRLRRWRDEG